jgi:hypothetical protein
VPHNLLVDLLKGECGRGADQGRAVHVEDAGDAPAVGTRLPLTRIEVWRLVDGSPTVATRDARYLHVAIVTTAGRLRAQVDREVRDGTVAPVGRPRERALLRGSERRVAGLQLPHHEGGNDEVGMFAIERAGRAAVRYAPSVRTGRRGRNSLQVSERWITPRTNRHPPMPSRGNMYLHRSQRTSGVGADP